jgi:KaiC/GvpD/RAD55 family RecA-like ATPase
MGQAEDLSDRLARFEDPAAVAIRLAADQYIEAIKGLTYVFAEKKDLDVVYVTTTVPSHTIVQVLKAFDISLDRIWFVDCISQMMMSTEAQPPHAVTVESPTMLENIMLKVEFLLRKSSGKHALVVLDSINSLAIHNNTKILSEFLHILVNNLRSQGAYTVIVSMQEYETEEIRGMLVLVSDETLEL